MPNAPTVSSPNVIIETVELAVRFKVDAVGQLPAYSDTLFMECDTDAGQWLGAAMERHGAWAERVLNPPPVIVGEPPDTEAALNQALGALNQAQQAVEDVIAAQAETPPSES